MSDYFCHPSSLVESTHIGRNTRIWAFAHVLPGAVVGEDCKLCDHSLLENDVIVGDRVVVSSSVQLRDGITLEDDVFVGPNATFTNNRRPRSKQNPDAPSRTVINRGASIGANATVLPGLSIGQYAMVEAGAVVTDDVPPYAIMVGNPARISGYVQTASANSQTRVALTAASDAEPCPVKGVTLHELPHIADLRGGLTFGEVGNPLPFAPQRYFLVFGVPSQDVRGEHAHRECHQFLICASGQCSVVVDDGANRAEYVLDRPNLGLHIAPMVWATQYKYSPEAVLLVLASEAYRAEDYIRDYDTFLREVRA